MTEEEWLKETDLNQLLSLVWQRRKASRRQRLPKTLSHRQCQRKLRLFVCACCRLPGSGELDPHDRQAITTAEAFADGLTSIHQLNAARAQTAAGLVRLATAGQSEVRDAAGQVAAYWVNRRSMRRLGLPPDAIPYKWRRAMWRLGLPPDAIPYKCVQDKEAWKAARAQEAQYFCDLLRDLMGNPFRPPSVLSSNWLAWQGGTVVALARAIYDEHSFDQLPVLGDALEDAGCDNQRILEHCRGQGPHARGCWLLDLLAGRD
jgi:hypothetical protein